MDRRQHLLGRARERCEALGHVDVTEPQYNLMHCRERLGALPAEDFRKGFPDFQEPQLSRALQVVERIRPLADELGATVSELVTAYAIADDKPVRRLTRIAVDAGYPNEDVEGYTTVDCASPAATSCPCPSLRFRRFSVHESAPETILELT